MPELHATMSNENDGAVRISPDKVYQEVLGMKEGLGRVEGLLEKHVALQEGHNSAVLERLGSHDTTLAKHGENLIRLDARVLVLETNSAVQKEIAAANERKRAPWWQIVATAIAVGGFLFIVLDRVVSFTALLQPAAP